MNIKNYIVIILLLILSVNASAYEWDLSETKPLGIEAIEFHGFFSQGYLKSEKNNVWAETKDGTFDFREFGINMSTNLTDELFVGAQLMGYRVGGLGDDKVLLHYALADYRMTDWLGFRGGLMRMPLGLYNETRDIDMLRASVFLPQSVYPDNLRDSYSSMLGGAVYGNVELDKIGSVDYQAQFGQVIMNDDPSGGVPYWQSSSGYLDDSDIDPKFGAVLDLKWNTPMDGLRLGWTYRHINSDSNGKVGWFFQGMGFPAGTRAKILTRDYDTNVFSLEYTYDRLTIAAEYMKTLGDLDYHVNGASVTTYGFDLSGWYVGASYELTDRVTIGAQYDEYIPDNNDKDGDRKVALGGSKYEAYRKTIGVFTKVDINDNWMMKFQVDFNKGVGGMRKKDLGTPSDIEKNSVLMSVKSVWYF